MIDAIVAERVGLARFTVEHIRQVRLLVTAGRVGADEADLHISTLNAFVGQVATGLHLPGGDDADTQRAVRKAVRAALIAEGLQPVAQS